MIQIRKETPADYENIFNVVKTAFEKAEHTDGDEQNLVLRLRKSEAFIPELSLVAEINGEIVGHILFTKIKVNDTIQVALAPVSVIPEQQGNGVGGRLIKEGHAIAKKLGYDFSILVGHPAYYPRFGYVQASDFGLKCCFRVPADVFMACSLSDNKIMLNGTAEFAKEFFEK